MASGAHNEISIRECFRFPIASAGARRDLLVGGLLMITLIFGWILNLGHRLEVVHRLAQGESEPFCGFAPYKYTFMRGLRALAAISLYLFPSAALGMTAWLVRNDSVVWSRSAIVASVIALVLGVFVLPGGMTYNAAYRDMSYLYRPDKAFARAIAGGRAYRKAWMIGLSAISLSFLGPLLGLIGFFFTSVWAWNVVGYAFSRALLPISPYSSISAPVSKTLLQD